MTRVLQACLGIALLWPARIRAMGGAIGFVFGRRPECGPEGHVSRRGSDFNGEGFKILWIIGNQQYAGTGILRDGKLAWLFRRRDGSPV